jgi:hypothetical protein
MSLTRKGKTTMAHGKPKRKITDNPKFLFTAFLLSLTVIEIGRNVEDPIAKWAIIIFGSCGALLSGTGILFSSKH